MSTSTGKRIHRFLIPSAAKSGQTIELEQETMHYASRVLRLLNHSVIHVWNGKGQIYPAQLNYLSKKKAEVVITADAIETTHNELKRPIYIAQALPEGDKMEWVLGKCTELGASGFFPLETKRSIVKLTEERATKKQQHWERLIASACVQSERLYLPKLFPVCSIADFFNEIKEWSPKPDVLLFTPEAKHHLTQWLEESTSTLSNKPIIIMIGPEGGFDRLETDWATKQSAHILRFSHRILRTETFALACLAQLTLGLKLEPC